MPDRSRIDELRRRVHANPASIAFAALAEEYRRAGMLDEAIATCRAGLLRHPAYLSARVTLGRALLDAGRHAEARDVFEQVLRAAPENLAAVRGLAEIHQTLLPSVELDHALPTPAQHDESPALAEIAVATAPPDPRILSLTHLLNGVARVRRSRIQAS